jgi:hypothetical protein
MPQTQYALDMQISVPETDGASSQSSARIRWLLVRKGPLLLFDLEAIHVANAYRGLSA